MNATEMAVLSGFWQKNGVGTLGVKENDQNATKKLGFVLS